MRRAWLVWCRTCALARPNDYHSLIVTVLHARDPSEKVTAVNVSGDVAVY